jgi:hypothetical protein
VPGCHAWLPLLPSLPLLARKQVGSILSQSPDLTFPLPSSERSQTWLLTTYLDEDTRITRGDGGSVFILVKEAPSYGSGVAPPPPSAEQAAVAEAMML